MSVKSRIALIVSAEGARRAAREIDDVADSTKRVGRETDTTGRKMRTAESASAGFAKGLQNVQTTMAGISESASSRGGLASALGGAAGAAVALLPVLVAVGGALVALAGSAAAAAGGLGVLAAGGVGVLGAGFAGLGLLVKGFAGNLDKIKTAQADYNLKVQEFGKYSEKAVKAHTHLQAVIALNGGTRVKKAMDTLDGLGDTFGKKTQPAMLSLYKVFGSVAAAAKRLVAPFAAVTNVAARAVGGPLTSALRRLSGPEMQGILRSLGDAFASIGGPLVRAASDVLLGLARSAKNAAPFFVSLVQGVGGLTSKFAAWAGSDGPGHLFQTLVGHTRSWWGLLKSVGALMSTVLGGGAAQGKGLVDALTGVLNRWNALLKTGDGQSSMKKFFKDSVGLTKVLAVGLLKVTGFVLKVSAALMPIYQTGFKAISQGVGMFLDAFRPAAPFFNNVLKPLLVGIGSAVLGSVVGAFKILVPILKVFMSALGWIGSKLGPLQGAFKAVGMVIGFVFGGAILKAISLLGKLSPVFRVVGAAARLLAIPLRLATGLFGGLFRIAGRVIGSFAGMAGRAIPALRGAFNRILGNIAALPGQFFTFGEKVGKSIVTGIVNAIMAAPDAVKNAIKSVTPDWVEGAVGGAAGAVGGAAGAVGDAGGAAGNFLGGLVGRASGGFVQPGETTLWKEEGPEIAQFPSGTRIYPHGTAPPPVDTSGAGRVIELHVHSHVGTREVAHDIRRIGLRDLLAKAAV